VKLKIDRFQLFPKSKFLWMVRDARATLHSIVTNKIVAPGYDLKVKPQVRVFT
jgi:hypothetical protein